MCRERERERDERKTTPTWPLAPSSSLENSRLKFLFYNHKWDAVWPGRPHNLGEKEFSLDEKEGGVLANQVRTSFDHYGEIKRAAIVTYGLNICAKNIYSDKLGTKLQ